MTSSTDTHATHDAPVLPERMPRAVRLGLMLALGGLITGAVYLLAVRGEALLVDLAALGERLWCF